MKPALSVILFSVLSGAGLDAIALTALAEISAHLRGHGRVAGCDGRGGIALVLVIAGLSASTLHLANPRNAWRSLTRWLVVAVARALARSCSSRRHRVHGATLSTWALTPALAVPVVLLAPWR
jgi:DMSO reductase anchor subunit